jgi:hypothetical protein
MCSWSSSRLVKEAARTRACRREVKLYIGVRLEPRLVFFVGVEVVEDDVKLVVRPRLVLQPFGHGRHSDAAKG